MIDPSLRPYLDYWAGAWADLPAGATVADRRAWFERLATEVRKPLPSGFESVVEYVHTRDRTVRVRVFRPVGLDPTPCLIYMHGGAWMQGSPETHDEIAVAIAHHNRQTVISVDYALAPEHPFPAAIEDCQAVVRWTYEQADRLAIRTDAVSIGGDSAGANLAAAMTLIFRGTACRLIGQLLYYPAIDFTFDRPSVQENADGPIITAASLLPCAAAYLPDPADRSNPLAAPIMADDHTGLPPAFIAVAEHDPLRDEGRAYAECLTAAGVAVTLHPGRGLFHGYLRAISFAAIAREPLDAGSDWLAALSQRQPALT